jgi:hypothetical protein
MRRSDTTVGAAVTVPVNARESGLAGTDEAAPNRYCRPHSHHRFHVRPLIGPARR